jgi:hypothetical protein
VFERVSVDTEHRAIATTGDDSHAVDAEHTAIATTGDDSHAVDAEHTAIATTGDDSHAVDAEHGPHDGPHAPHYVLPHSVEDEDEDGRPA